MFMSTGADGTCCERLAHKRWCVAIPYFIMAFVTLGTALASFEKKLSMEKFFAEDPSPLCVMNRVGSVSAVLFSCFAILTSIVLWCAPGCAKYKKPMSEQVGRNITVFFGVLLNTVAVLTYSVDVAPRLTYSYAGPSCVSATQSSARRRRVTRISPTPSPTPSPSPEACFSCKSIHDVTRFVHACEGDLTFDCDYKAPSLWVATMVMLCLMLAINVFFLLVPTIVALQNGRKRKQPMSVQMNQMNPAMSRPSAPTVSNQPNGSMTVANSTVSAAYNAELTAPQHPGITVPLALPVDFVGETVNSVSPEGDKMLSQGAQKPLNPQCVANMDTTTISRWLEQTGRGAYAAAFAAAGIDGAVLCHSSTTAELLVEAVPGLPLIIAMAILRNATAAD